MTVHESTVSRCPIHIGRDDLVDPTLYSDGNAYDVWRQLRAVDGLSWRQVDESRGFFSAVRFDDAEFVLSNHAVFTSERGTLLDLLGTDDPAGGTQLAVTDPPRHTEMQTRLKKTLAIKAVDRQRDMIRAKILRLIEPLGDGGVYDFADAMLAMPMAVTGTMMGLPEADWEWLIRVNTTCIAPDDPEYRSPAGRGLTLAVAHHELFGYFQELVRHRRDHLGSDLISTLITTQFEGRHMSIGEIVSNCYSLLLGANVTTPHSPSFVLAEFIDTDVLADWAAHPEVGPTAVEEALRWASPVNHFLRYATRDVELSGTPISAGDAVVVWLGAANRDDGRFPEASTFDIRRKPNKHLAFGAGPHYCVGHSVARVTLRILFEELLARYEDFRPAGPPVRLVSNFVSGYKHVPITARRRK
ncbi:MAG: cytochrome P450 [Kibdelosporangium sp.]